MCSVIGVRRNAKRKEKKKTVARSSHHADGHAQHLNDIAQESAGLWMREEFGEMATF